MKFKRVYIDGDFYLYKLAFATQKNIYHCYVNGSLAHIGSDKRYINTLFKDTEYSYEKYLYVQPVMKAVFLWDNFIKEMQQKFKGQVIVAFTGPTNFRNDIATILEYKAGRADKPENYAALKKYAVSQPHTIIADNEEADDILSKALWADLHDQTLIITPDKDLNNTPGWHYNSDKDELLYWEEMDSIRHFYEQLLAGDKAVDNIPGLPRIGMKTAKKILADCHSIQEMEREVALQYCKYYDDPEIAILEVGRLLWMRRTENELWEPEYYK